MLGEMTSEQIEQLLRTEMIGRVGCYSDGKVYIVPVTYAYDGNYIYAHSSEGRKVRMMREHPRVCFEVENVESMANWRTVVVDGTFEELIGDEASHAMEFLMERFLPYLGTTSETLMPAHGSASASGHAPAPGNHQAIVYRIRVGEKSGRFETR